MTIPGFPNRTRQPSRVLERLLDPSKKLDYLYAFIIGVLPIGVSILVGASYWPDQLSDSSSGVFHEGYLNQPNWWSLAFLLPAVLFVLRRLMGRIAAIHTQWPPANIPPIIRLITQQESQPIVYEKLRHAILDKRNFVVTVVLVTIITILDMWPLLSLYFNPDQLTPSELEKLDWASIFIICASDASTPVCTVSKTGNSLLVAVAYFAQYVITFIGILSIILILRHNLFFLGNVYQRRRTAVTPEDQLFKIDIYDVDRCFGFRRCYGAFNTQLVALMIAGLAMLLSRYAHTVKKQSSEVSSSSLLPMLSDFSFPVAGQWAMAVAWLAALFIVALPGTVKLLPRTPGQHSDSLQASVKDYLREFFADGQWPTDEKGEEKSILYVASRFANNSFWPTGDNRARSLFSFSYWIFMVILQPPALTNTVTLMLTLVIYALLAYLATLATFKAMNLLLAYVDPTLVKQKNIEEGSGGNMIHQERAIKVM